MNAPKKIAASADSTGANGQIEPQDNLESMLEGLLKSTPKLAQPGAVAEGQRCGLVAIVGKAFFVWMNFGNLKRIGSFN